jgi:hypothetical protein
MLTQSINTYNLELIHGTVTCSAGIGRHVHAMTFPEVSALRGVTSPHRAARDLVLALSRQVTSGLSSAVHFGCLIGPDSATSKRSPTNSLPIDRFRNLRKLLLNISNRRLEGQVWASF